MEDKPTYLLSLETSTKVCSVAIHGDGQLVGRQSYHLTNSHSELLPEIIRELLINSQLTQEDLAGIALSKGPGSYTGLRIGASVAKSLAFTLNKPLVGIDTLDVMMEQVWPFADTGLYSPMIDARRMEVYCKLWDSEGQVIWDTNPLIVDEHTFDAYKDRKVTLFGNGAEKFKGLFGEHVRILDGFYPDAAFMGILALKAFQAGQFEDIAYFEPDYLKEYRTNLPGSKFQV